MKIHEYQSKSLFKAAGIAVPDGIVCKSADEVATAFETLGGELAVVKSQIHAGGRGKGRFKEHPDQPGVSRCVCSLHGHTPRRYTCGEHREGA